MSDDPSQRPNVTAGLSKARKKRMSQRIEHEGPDGFLLSVCRLLTEGLECLFTQTRRLNVTATGGRRPHPAFLRPPRTSRSKFVPQAMRCPATRRYVPFPDIVSRRGCRIARPRTRAARREAYLTFFRPARCGAGAVHLASAISDQDVAHLARQFIRTERLHDEGRSWAENPDINCVIFCIS